MKYHVILLCCIIFGDALAQDKLFLKNGKKINCSIISIEQAAVIYKDSASAEKIISIPKQDLLLADPKNGKIIVFNSESTVSNATPHKKRPGTGRMSEEKKQIEKNFSDHIIGIQIPDLTFGRLTFSYEHLFLNKQMGLVIPFSLTYDPRILFANNPRDTLVTKNNPIRKNAGFITGLDLNWYFDTRGYSKFFVGPRLRYGTDVLLLNISGYSLQFQNGFLLAGSQGKMTCTVGFGFGFVRVLSSPYGSGINPKQSYPWGSFTLRVGFRA